MSRRKQARPSRLEDQLQALPSSALGNVAEEDANNNEEQSPSKEDSSNPDKDTSRDDEPEVIENEKEILTNSIQALLNNMMHWPIPSNNLTMDDLQNTKVAITQFTIKALESNPSTNDLKILHQTLFTIQQQQLFQLQLLQQYQCSNSSSNEESISQRSSPVVEQATQQNATPPPPTGPAAAAAAAVGQLLSIQSDLNSSLESSGANKSPNMAGNQSKLNNDRLNPHFASLLNCQNNQDPNLPLSPGLNNFLTHAADSENEHDNTTNIFSSLEMLQKRTQEVLDSASQGLLQSSLIDDPNRKRLNGDKSREPFFKHRCRYCGKVFGSDSALQIHIRSHTGERPFKCNVCGSRFTTKGNLKVHFQRHTNKFPHIKMNPHPVPEHLDHFHPPLITSSGQTTPEPQLTQQPPQPNPQELSPQPIPFNHKFEIKNIIQPFNQTTMLRLVGIAERIQHPILIENNLPEDLSNPKKKMAATTDDDEKNEKEKSSPPKVIRNEKMSEDEDENEEEERKFNGEKLRGAKVNNFKLNESNVSSDYNEDSCDSGDQPENLSSKSLPLMYQLPLKQARPDRPQSLTSQHYQSLNNETKPHNNDPSRDPAIYTNLLPRPGSNDNAWESLIEVTKTSETTKLQQLVDNIEHKLTDPNQCIICHRVLSCKSALQMHYRTHTGERPFKCKICGRAFTTKGNLKTHMGVHRAKPPLRVLHQCPVCHKRFTNSLVLQQHIRLHTGEPTDLTIDQIRAAEVRDPLLYPNNSLYANTNFQIPNFIFGHHPPPNELPPNFLGNSNQNLNENNNSSSPPPNLPGGATGNGAMREASTAAAAAAAATALLNAAGSSGSSNTDIKPEIPAPAFSTSLAALENHVRTITTTFTNSTIQPNSINLIQSLKGGRQTSSLAPEDEEDPESESDSISNISSESGQWTKDSESIPLDLTAGGNSSEQDNGNCGGGGSSSSSKNNFIPIHPFHMSRPNDYSSIWSRGNTTCNICLKTFACNSALEIHYRSHTKERPFKCSVCDRGFSTKGNAKQHFLTHKMKEVESSKGSSTCLSDGEHSSSNLKRCSSSETSLHSIPKKMSTSPSPRASTPRATTPATTGSSTTPTNSGMSKDSTANSPPPDLPSPDENEEKSVIKPPITPTSTSNSHHSHSHAHGHSHSQSSSSHHHQQQHSQDTKHLCKVCHKNFSSSSSVHIHMRTHTGDKPFKCNVCQKAFTTKGNLKVHMGTHMWTNGISRRGRRMSLELNIPTNFISQPMQLPSGANSLMSTIKSHQDQDHPPHSADHLAHHHHHRPELFFPFLQPNQQSYLNTSKMKD